MHARQPVHRGRIIECLESFVSGYLFLVLRQSVGYRLAEVGFKERLPFYGSTYSAYQR